MAGRWFLPGTLVSSTNKTDGHDIAEILLKVALSTITVTPNLYYIISCRSISWFKWVNNYWTVHHKYPRISGAYIVVLFVFGEWMWEVIVRFADIGGIVDNQCLNCLFIILHKIQNPVKSHVWGKKHGTYMWSCVT